MPRRLVKKQTEVIDRAFSRRKNETSVEEIPGLVAELEKINDYETLIQDANRYFFDRVLAATYLEGCSYGRI